MKESAVTGGIVTAGHTRSIHGIHRYIAAVPDGFIQSAMLNGDTPVVPAATVVFLFLPFLLDLFRGGPAFIFCV